MKEKLHEQLSALVDDELADFEQELLVKRVSGDAGLQKRLSSYQLISDALQNHLPERVDTGFHASVREAIKDEPTAQPASGGLAALFRPLAGLAVAASVAVVAVFSLQSARQEDPASAVAIANAPADDGRTLAEAAPLLVKNPAAQGLDVYLVNHNEYAVNRGMLPYVRLVGHEMNVESKD
jgi:negative regulator of sigma E activity